jgi:serine/threonine protein kinase
MIQAICPPYIVMEYCEHGSLRSWIGSKRPWQYTAYVLAHVLYGLHTIHGAGGFHRDLKPDNILVAKSPLAPEQLLFKVSDFGLARAPGVDSQPMTRTAAGTDGYIAPEVLAGAPFTAKSDIYSLGVVAVELLTGSRDTAQLGGVMLPEQLRKLIRQMTAQSPEVRPTTQSVAQSLQELLNTPGLVATIEAQNQADTGTADSLGDFIVKGLVAGGIFFLLAAIFSDGKPSAPKGPMPG